MSGMLEFARSGFGSFIEEYRAADVLDGSAVTVSGAQDVLQGRACGIDTDGALRLSTPEGIERIVSGDVSVRRA